MGELVLTPARQAGLLYYLIAELKELFLETLYSGMGRWIISVVHFERITFIMVNKYGVNCSANNITLFDVYFFI